VSVLRPDYVVVWDQNNRLVDVNDAVCELLEYTREELIDKHHSEFCVPDPAIGEELFREVQARGELSGFYVLKTRTGRSIEILFMAKRLTNGFNRSVWKLLRDDHRSHGA
jgi:PAS domain S-box-containing protein